MKFELAAVSAGEVHTGRGIISLVAWRSDAPAARLLLSVGPCLHSATDFADHRRLAARLRAVGHAGRTTPPSVAPLTEDGR